MVEDNMPSSAQELFVTDEEMETGQLVDSTVMVKESVEKEALVNGIMEPVRSHEHEDVNDGRNNDSIMDSVGGDSEGSAKSEMKDVLSSNMNTTDTALHKDELPSAKLEQPTDSQSNEEPLKIAEDILRKQLLLKSPERNQLSERKNSLQYNSNREVTPEKSAEKKISEKVPVLVSSECLVLFLFYTTNTYENVCCFCFLVFISGS